MTGNNEFQRARQFAGDFLIGIAVFLAVLALACSEHNSAFSAPAYHIKRHVNYAATQVSPANVTSGTLFIADDAAGADTPLRRAQHVSSSVDVVVNGPIARFSITQTFSNKTGSSGRGHFAFPLPIDTTIDVFSVQAGDRFIEGKLVKQAVAARLLADARSAGRPAPEPTPDYAGATSIDIDRIDANADVTIRLEYSQLLQSDAGSTSLHFPLLGLSPPGDNQLRSVNMTGQPIARSRANPVDGTANVSLRIRLDAGFPLGTIQSNSHDISVRKNVDGTAILTLSQGRIFTDKNLLLTWQVQKSASPELAILKELAQDGGHVLAMLSAPEIARGSLDQPRDIIFAVDTSGSMAGPSLSQLKRSLQTALSKLAPRDRFNIITFNSRADTLFKKTESLTPESLARGLSFISGLEARGGTEALSALNAALNDNRPEDPQRVRQIVFVTDGEIAGAAEFLSHIAEKRGRSRLFMVGIGSDISEAVMRRAAEIGRGKFLHVNSRSDVDTQLTALAEKLQKPFLTDLHVEWPKGVRADASPNPLPDLYGGETLLLSGELSSIKGDITVTGKLGGQPWTKTYSLANAVSGKGISKFWTRNKIAALEARRYTGQRQTDVDTAVEAVALKHGVVSRRTLLVGMDLSPKFAKDHALASEDLPVIPASAWTNDGISRTPVPELAVAGASSSASVPGEADRSLVTSAMPNVELGPGKDGGIKVAGLNGSIGSALSGPGRQPGNAGPLNWTLGLMAIVFAIMTALTLGLWRHLHHAVEPRRSGKRISRTH